MLFSSLTFLCFFLPAVLIGHSLLPERFRNGFLLAASIFFYAFGDARYLPLVLGMTVANWLLGRAIGAFEGKRKRAATAFSVVLNVGVLVFYKYTGMLFPNWEGVPALPLGISFFIFQSLSYLLDVDAGRVPAEKSLPDYATYILLFPQLIAGPIVRYSQVAKELHKREITFADLEKGMLTFVIGLGAKVLLANRMGALFQQLLAVETRGSLGSWMALVACAFQIYYDFAGYSLMAIGIGRMLGFRFPENFRHPFVAASMQEFWRRWHITLGDWLKTYLYIPLGGSRKGTARRFLNLMIVWAVSGLWHGAGYNFLFWGLLSGLLIIFEGAWLGKHLQKHRFIGHVYLIVFFLLSGLFFSFETPETALAFGGQLLNLSIGPNVLFILLCSLFPLLLSLLFCLPKVCDGGYAYLEKHSTVRVIAMVGLTALCIMSLIRSQYNPFIYFRF